MTLSSTHLKKCMSEEIPEWIVSHEAKLEPLENEADGETWKAISIFEYIHMQRKPTAHLPEDEQFLLQHQAIIQVEHYRDETSFISLLRGPGVRKVRRFHNYSDLIMYFQFWERHKQGITPDQLEALKNTLPKEPQEL